MSGAFLALRSGAKKWEGLRNVPSSQPPVPLHPLPRPQCPGLPSPASPSPHPVTTLRSLLPQFKSIGGECFWR